MHFYKYPTDPAAGAASPAPTYRYSIMRTMGATVDWCYVETSDNVFDWSRMDTVVDFFAAAGKDVYYQIYYTPTFHAQGAWAGVADKDRGKIGGTAPPDLTKLARFVTALITRYNTESVRNNGGAKKIKFISPWNEVKCDEPVVQVNYTTLTGAINVGDTVSGVTSGQSGTVLKHDTTNKFLQIKLSNTIAAGAIPHQVGETVQKSVGNSVVCTAFKTLYYWSGTPAQMAAQAKTVYQAAKAVDPAITVMSPEFVEGYDGELDHIAAWANSADGAGGYGSQWCDSVAYHFYNYDAPARVTKFGFEYPVVQRFSDLSATFSASGLTGKPIHASECGYTSGWKFIDTVTEPKNRVAVLKRTAACIAALGAKSWIGFAHDVSFIGDPSVNADIASAIDEIGRVLQGATITSFKVYYGYFVVFVANGREYIW